MKRKKITWRRDCTYGCYMPSRGSSNSDTACFVSVELREDHPYRAIDKFYGESRSFKSRASAQRWCEKRILART